MPAPGPLPALLALIALACAAPAWAAQERCYGQALEQESEWFGEYKRFVAGVKDLKGCAPLNISKAYLQGSCTSRDNNFANQNLNCGPLAKVLDASEDTCNKVFAQGGKDDFATVTKEETPFDAGLICYPSTGSRASSQKVFFFYKTSCSNGASIKLDYRQDCTDSCGRSNCKERGLFSKISRAVFGVIIAIVICCLLCCCGVAAYFMCMRKRNKPAAQQNVQMQSQYGGQGGPGGPPPGYGQPPGGYNPNYNQGYGGQPGGQPYSKGNEATGYPAYGQPAGGKVDPNKPAGYPAV